MPFQPGQSGNPNGRPFKNRALTEILARGGAHTVEYNGKRISGRRLIALYLWQAATLGEVTLVGVDKKLVLSPHDWVDTIKWLYTQIDGPPKAEMDVTSGGQPLEVIFRYAGDEKEREE